VHHGQVPLFAFEGHEPEVSPAAWIAPTATLVGDVRVEAEASIWYGAVLRADFGPIIVRRGANVQDGSVLHGGDDPLPRSARERPSVTCVWSTARSFTRKH
jgi:carbonic anhydrase/acetyltransferase-like protein (isoleucine patch superfamily)